MSSNKETKQGSKEAKEKKRKRPEKQKEKKENKNFEDCPRYQELVKLAEAAIARAHLEDDEVAEMNARFLKGTENLRIFLLTDQLIPELRLRERLQKAVPPKEIPGWFLPE